MRAGSVETHREAHSPYKCPWHLPCCNPGPVTKICPVGLGIPSDIYVDIEAHSELAPDILQLSHCNR